MKTFEVAIHAFGIAAATLGAITGFSSGDHAFGIMSVAAAMWAGCSLIHVLELLKERGF